MIQRKLCYNLDAVVWQLMALLLLRHALSITDDDGEGDDDASTFFSVSIFEKLMLFAFTLLR